MGAKPGRAQTCHRPTMVAALLQEYADLLQIGGGDQFRPQL
jgi:hypothetical protein